MTTTIDPRTIPSTSTVLDATISVRTNFSVLHLLSAARLSRLVVQVERDNAGQPFGPFFDELLAYATACVMTSVAGLESYANEVFLDYQRNFPDADGPLLEKIWSFYEGKPLLEKFQFAMFLRHVPDLDKGADPYQSIDALVQLRNGLIHFKPEWSNKQVEHRKLANRLRNYFDPSPYYPGSRFPLGWATANCTKWAVSSCIQFVSHFEEQTGLEHRLTKFMDRLAVE